MKSSTGPQVEPVADLREAEGEVNKRGTTPSGKTSGGRQGLINVCKTKEKMVRASDRVNRYQNMISKRVFTRTIYKYIRVYNGSCRILSRGKLKLSPRFIGNIKVINLERHLNLNTFSFEININRSIPQGYDTTPLDSCPFTPVSDLSTPKSTTSNILWNDPRSYIPQFIKCSIHQRNNDDSYTNQNTETISGNRGDNTSSNNIIQSNNAIGNGSSSNLLPVNGKATPGDRVGNFRQFYPSSKPMKLRSRFKNIIFFRKGLNIPSIHKVPKFATDMTQILPMADKAYTIPKTIPYEFKIHESKQISKWYWYYNMEAMQYNWYKKHLPIPYNHTFIGLPIHFSTSDTNEIRNLLTCTKRFKKLIVNDVDKPIYVIYAKVYPLLGGILSTWIFIGCHIPWKI